MCIDMEYRELKILKNKLNIQSNLIVSKLCTN